MSELIKRVKKLIHILRKLLFIYSDKKFKIKLDYVTYCSSFNFLLKLLNKRPPRYYTKVYFGTE